MKRPRRNFAADRARAGHGLEPTELLFDGANEIYDDEAKIEDHELTAELRSMQLSASSGVYAQRRRE